MTYESHTLAIRRIETLASVAAAADRPPPEFPKAVSKITLVSFDDHQFFPRTFSVSHSLYFFHYLSFLPLSRKSPTFVIYLFTEYSSVLLSCCAPISSSFLRICILFPHYILYSIWNYNFPRYRSYMHWLCGIYYRWEPQQRDIV